MVWIQPLTTWKHAVGSALFVTIACKMQQCCIVNIYFVKNALLPGSTGRELVQCAELKWVLYFSWNEFETIFFRNKSLYFRTSLQIKFISDNRRPCLEGWVHVTIHSAILTIRFIMETLKNKRNFEPLHEGR